MRDGGQPPHLLHVFSTFVPAGPEMRTVRLINALGDRYRHSILAMDGRTDARSQLDPEAPVELLPSLPRRGSAQTVRDLRKLQKTAKPDLVLSYNWGAFDSVFASCSLGRQRRHIHHEDGFNADESRGFKTRRVWTRRLTLPHLARVVVPSRLLEGIASETWKLRSEKLELIPNGIDLDSFEERHGHPELRRELGIPEQAPVIGFVGHLRPVKNPLRLLQAFAALRCEPRPVLLVLGEGPERESLEQAIDGLGLAGRVHLVGHQSDPAPWYRMMDLFAISSDSEQMPIALLEAMASSLPVVSTDVGDVNHMLADEQSPYVVGGEEPELVPGLSAALESLIAEPETRTRLGAANRHRVEQRYSFQTMLESYRQLYDATLQR